MNSQIGQSSLESLHYGLRLSPNISGPVTNTENVYIKSPFKQSSHIKKSNSRAPQSKENLNFMVVAPSVTPRLEEKNISIMSNNFHVEPSTELIDETAYATYQLHQGLKSLHITNTQKPNFGVLRKGRLEKLDPVKLEGPLIDQCKGFVPDYRDSLSQSVQRRGLLIAKLRHDKALEEEKLNNSKEIDKRITSKNVDQNINYEEIEMSVHQTSISSEDHETSGILNQEDANSKEECEIKEDED